MLQITGINGLKAASGSFAFNTGAYDSVSKIYFLAPTPTQGILKLFMMPPTNLRPEPWVPATVASYGSLSWDLDGAYNYLERPGQPVYARDASRMASSRDWSLPTAATRSTSRRTSSARSATG